VLIVVAAVIAAGAFLVLRPEDEDEPERAETTAQPADTAPQPTAPQQTTPEARPQEPEIPTVRVRGGRPVGGVQTIEAERGDTVRFRVRTETPQEIHLHGYDITENSTAGKPAEFRFEADESGIYEIEVHGTHTQIAELKVE
jgi:FtsP/CotA-like multicopper oxidase with cupredoxin domain